jgi:hypothetical protein
VPPAAAAARTVAAAAATAASTAPAAGAAGAPGATRDAGALLREAPVADLTAGAAHGDAERLGEQLVQVDHVDVLASPASDSGRSDHGQALTRVSTSSSAARSSRAALIFAVSAGFSTGSPPPAPEQ